MLAAALVAIGVALLMSLPGSAAVAFGPPAAHGAPAASSGLAPSGLTSAGGTSRQASSYAESSLALTNGTWYRGAPAFPNCPSPSAPAVAHHSLYVYCYSFDDAEVLNETTLAYEATIPPPPTFLTIGGMAYDPSTNWLYFGEQGFVGFTLTSRIQAFNLSNDSWGVSWSTNVLPTDVLYDPADGWVWELASPQNYITAYNATTGTSPAAILMASGHYPGAARINPKTNWMYVPLSGLTGVDVYNLSSNLFVAHVTTSADVSGVGFDPIRDYVYLSQGAADDVVVLNGTTDTTVATVPVGTGPGDIGYDPSAHEMYVANAGGSNVTRLNITTLASPGSIPTGIGPGNVIYLPDSNDMAVLHPTQENVTLVNSQTGQPVGSVQLGAYPVCTFLDPANGALLVGDNWANTVRAYHTNLLINATPFAWVYLNTSPAGFAYDGALNEIAVAGQGPPNDLVFLNASTLAVLGNVSLPFRPYDVLYLSDTEQFLVVDTYANNVTLVNATTNTVTTGFYLPLPTGIASDPALHEFFVSDFGDASTGNQPTLVAFNDRTDVPIGNSTLASYPNAYSLGFDAARNRLFVGGGNTSAYNPATLGVEFTLPSSHGGPVAVRPDGVVAVGGYPGTTVSTGLGPDQIAQFSTRDDGSIALDPTNGALYIPDVVNASIRIGIIGPTIANLTASPNPVYQGNSTTISVKTVAVTPPVSFVYSGLPDGCSGVHGASFVCATKTPGNYTVSVTATDGSGLASIISITFEVKRSASSGGPPYSVTFTESGLPTGTSWSVTLGGTTRSSTATTSVWSLGIGTYSYSISATGYSATPPAGSVIVFDAPVAVPITFTAVGASQTGWIQGSVQPSSAHVSIDGALITVASGGFNITVSAGAHQVNATASGYAELEKSVNVQAGKTAQVSLILGQNKTPPVGNTSGSKNVSNGSGAVPFGGLGEIGLVALVVVAVVVIAAVAIALRMRSKPGAPESPDPSGGAGEAGQTPGEVDGEEGTTGPPDGT